MSIPVLTTPDADRDGDPAARSAGQRLADERAVKARDRFHRGRPAGSCWRSCPPARC